MAGTRQQYPAACRGRRRGTKTHFIAGQCGLKNQPGSLSLASASALGLAGTLCEGYPSERLHDRRMARLGMHALHLASPDSRFVLHRPPWLTRIPLHGPIEGRIAVMISHLVRCSPLYQQVDKLKMATHRCEHQRGLPLCHQAIDVCAVLEEVLGHLIMTIRAAQHRAVHLNPSFVFTSQPLRMQCLTFAKCPFLRKMDGAKNQQSADGRGDESGGEKNANLAAWNRSRLLAP